MSIGNTKNILGKPQFEKIGQRRAVLEEKLGKSLNVLAVAAGISNKTADDWSDNQIENPTRTVKDFLRHYRIRMQWWQTGEGDVFEKNGTYVKSPMETPKNEKVPEEIYRDLVEANSDYRLIPKAILDDYDILPKKEMENRNKMMDLVTKAMNESKDSLIEKYELIIKGLDNTIARLESEKADLIRQIPAKK